jgi:hypothetical protein
MSAVPIRAAAPAEVPHSASEHSVDDDDEDVSTQEGTENLDVDPGMTTDLEEEDAELEMASRIQLIDVVAKYVVNLTAPCHDASIKEEMKAIIVPVIMYRMRQILVALASNDLLVLRETMKMA